MLAEHKYLAIVFVLALIAAAVYLFRAPHKTLTIEPPPPPPIYIEAIPQQPVPDKAR
jgi:hypothetical protein